MSIRRNHSLEQRGHAWYYVRRVPSRYREIDKRLRVKAALHTDSLTIAHERRDVMMDADDHFWETSLLIFSYFTFSMTSQNIRLRTCQSRPITSAGKR